MKRPVDVQGAVEPLFVTSLACSCGNVEYDGIAFAFADRGPWVIGLDELKAIVAEAETAQSAPEHLAWRRRCREEDETP